MPGRADDAQHPVLTVPTVAALVALDRGHLGTFAMALVGGWGRPGDGGGGMFLWQPDGAEPPDGVVTLAPRAGMAGRWVRLGWNGRLTPEMAGAVGDGSTDDIPAFNRLIEASRAIGAFTISLTPGRRYYLGSLLGLSEAAPGLVVEGPGSPRYDVPSGHLEAPVTRLELNTANGATIKLGSGQILRNVLVWRHGLVEAPQTLAEVRHAVATWYAEDGSHGPRSIGVFAPFDDATIEGCRIIGFHTGILLTAGRFKLADDHIDTAGYAVEVTGSKATSLIENVAAGALWSRPAPGSDAYGDSGYRPGTAYYIHGGADGLQINSVGAENWVTGIWLAGSNEGTDWLISMLQPDIETPPNNGQWTAGIRTSGEIRRVMIMDPRILSGGNGSGPSAALDFGHSSSNPEAADNNNVTVIGGSLEASSDEGVAVMIRAGATGSMIGVTMNQAKGRRELPLVRVLAGAGEWRFALTDLRGGHPESWLEADPSVAKHMGVLAMPKPFR